jgi:hypothetical protein
MSSEKIEAFWENATADDVARVMAGETVEARFRDCEEKGWNFKAALGGYDSTDDEGLCWIESSSTAWKFCQVYCEPSWYANKPDPGPGYRLLEKFSDEELKEHDEWWNGTCWGVSLRFASGPQSEGVWYRRRIEPVEPEPKHYTLRVGDTVETPSGHQMKLVSPGTCQMQYDLKAGYTATLPNGQTITITEKGFEVTQ